jgi:hypothetical protein
MKTKLAVLASLLCIPFVGPWEGAVSARVPDPTRGTLFVSSFLPVLNASFDDLDVRDAQNKPVSSPIAKTELKGLFLENLLLLGVAGPTHQMRELWNLLDYISHLFRSSILTAAKRIKEAVEALLQTVERRLVHNVGKLWISFSVNAKCSARHLNLPRFSTSFQTLTLRC